MRPHSSKSIESATPLLYSQTSCENATSSSDTSPLASNKEVPPPRTEPEKYKRYINIFIIIIIIIIIIYYRTSI